MWRYALAKVATVTGASTRCPSPNRPMGPSYTCPSAFIHCCRRAQVGTKHRHEVRVPAIAASATWVLPAPVGSATTPRRPARRQPARPAPWYWRSSTPRNPDGGPNPGQGAFDTTKPRRRSADASGYASRAGARWAPTRASQRTPGRSIPSAPSGMSLSRIVPRSKISSMPDENASPMPAVIVLVCLPEASRASSRSVRHLFLNSGDLICLAVAACSSGPSIVDARKTGQSGGSPGTGGGLNGSGGAAAGTGRANSTDAAGLDAPNGGAGGATAGSGGTGGGGTDAAGGETGPGNYPPKSRTRVKSAGCATPPMGATSNAVPTQP